MNRPHFSLSLLLFLLISLIYAPASAQTTCSTQMFERGTNNSWNTTPMTLVDVSTCTWQVTVDFGSAADERFKFDKNGDWSDNFGDNGGDGFVDADGDDIPITGGVGTYTLTFIESTGAYTIEQGVTSTNTPAPTITPSPQIMCTPPSCANGTLQCDLANGCPGGCGTICVLPDTPTPTTIPTLVPPGGSGELYASSTSTVENGSVNVTVRARNIQAGLNRLTFDVDYDATLVDATNCDVAAPFIGACNVDAGVGKVRFSMVYVTELTGAFAIGDVDFTAIGSAPATADIMLDIDLMAETHSIASTTSQNGIVNIFGSDVPLAVSLVEQGEVGGSAELLLITLLATITALLLYRHRMTWKPLMLLLALLVSGLSVGNVIGNAPSDGDVDCDGVAVTADALSILEWETWMPYTLVSSCAAGTSATHLNQSACDVSLDGTCDSLDALFIAQCDVNISNMFCPTAGDPTNTPIAATSTSLPPALTATPSPTSAPVDGIVIHYKGQTSPNIYAWLDNAGVTTNLRGAWPGTPMTQDASGWYTDSFPDETSINLIFNGTSWGQTPDLMQTAGEWWYTDGVWTAYNPDNDEPPTVAITSPAGGSVSGVTNVTVNAADDIGIDKVEFYLDGQLLGQTSTAPYTYNWTTSTSCGGTGQLTAVAHDIAGNTTTSAAVTVTVNNPNQAPVADAGGTVRAIVGVSARFDASGSTDDCGIVSYSWDNGLTGETAMKIYNTVGTYNVTLTVTDAAGLTDTDVVIVEVTDQPDRGDFREESIYFLMTTRFYDGDSSNNMFDWDGQQAGNWANNDPAWRGDFEGLVEKLDYIKALGFSAIWITPIAKNISGYDYHGYHAVNFMEVDPRYESPGYDFQRLIDEVHARDMKIIQDVVYNHTGNFGEENLYPLFTKDDPNDPSWIYDPAQDTAENLFNIAPPGLLPANYDTLTPQQQYAARIDAMKEDTLDTEHIYHHHKTLNWEEYSVQIGQIAGDAVDLNTENPIVYNYLIDAYNQYIDMGVDAFRVDTVKHISRLTFNNVFNPAFKARGGENFFMFGEVAARYRQVWNQNIPPVSVPFYTWAETQSYPWSETDRTVNEASVAQHWDDNANGIAGQPTSNNHLLNGNDYHTPDRSQSSGMDMIDFPMHWNFANARDSFSLAVGTDEVYNDATWNVVYVDSHDYAPDTAPENQRFAMPQDVWAENLSLMWTFRGIPTLYYGSEIEFKKGEVIDVGPNAPLEDTGRAYFGDHIEGSITVSDFGMYSGATGEIATTLNHPLAQHIRRLNLIRREVPALQKGQYSVDGVSGDAMAFKRRFTEGSVDSFALIAVSGSATFSGIPGGTYVDVITGDSITVSGGGTLTASASGKGNLRVYVLNGSGKIGDDGMYLKP